MAIKAVGGPFGAAASFTTPDKRFPLKTKVMSDNGGQLLYCYIAESAAVGEVLGVNATGSATLLHNKDFTGKEIGVAPIALSAGYYGWIITNGSGFNLKTGASCAARKKLWIRASAVQGIPDDASATSGKALQGLFLTSAASSTSGSLRGAYIVGGGIRIDL